MTQQMRPVSVASIGLMCPGGIGVDGATGGQKGPVPGFSARAWIRNRKNLKLMSRAVKLGVSTIQATLSERDDWEKVPPRRRGMYVGSTPLGGETQDLLPAIEAALQADGHIDIPRFGRDGYPLVHPLWLVKGLSNNVLGFASAIHDFQGVNANYCDGDASGINALYEGWAAVAEGRADVVVAGAADAWVGLEPLLAGRRCGEGAAFFLLRPARPADPWQVLPEGGSDLDREEDAMGFLGAAGDVVAIARALLRGEEAGFSGPGTQGLRFVKGK